VLDVDLDVRAGEIVALLGPNGAGKSTLLSVLAGDLATMSGDVRIAGDDVHRLAPATQARLRAVLPQRVSVAFPFTVAEVVAMGRAPWSSVCGAAEDDAAIARAVEECDLAPLLDRPLPAVSGGEAARVSLARVLAQETQLVLLDEPTAALDLRHQEQIFAVLRRRADLGVAFVVVLHDLTAAAAHADRIVLMRGGRVLADGPPADALRSELLHEAYEHELEVFTSPRTGAVAVVPVTRGNP
jgi:iron complex transport system ATP-binding protein